jgi:hypothetical protein
MSNADMSSADKASKGTTVLANACAPMTGNLMWGTMAARSPSRITLLVNPGSDLAHADNCDALPPLVLPMEDDDDDDDDDDDENEDALPPTPSLPLVAAFEPSINAAAAELPTTVSPLAAPAIIASAAANVSALAFASASAAFCRAWKSAEALTFAHAAHLRNKSSSLIVSASSFSKDTSDSKSRSKKVSEAKQAAEFFKM